ncbi:3-phosphoshikimate 1-carboxyvinyltransferase [Thermococcus sp. GR7]|nr:3-phosphoshikimate 1-carboxyvinyltransferase [Thermococcus sp. GR7]NJE78607.1 3-phosphoshikimate 1-carboxyvinyltransferase [Thermococcus sp. GR4]NJF23515.1 3-phosphoshikimate 1-carboxyvinyltransferase [Thermococcus sp. GR5]
MGVIIRPVGEVTGEVEAPPSKSYTHRAYFLALLAEGRSKVKRPLVSDDTLATLNAIRAFGASVEGESIIPPEWPKGAFIDAHESGTTARIALAVASIGGGESTVNGGRRLRERPFGELVRALRKAGAEIEGERLPLRVIGRNLRRRDVEVDASTSSQFATALLIIGAKVGMEVLIKRSVSRPYIEVTARTLKAFGADFRREGFDFYIEPGITGTSFTVPGDYSSASFFLAAGALYGRVKIRNLDPKDVQADRAIIDALREFGAEVKVGRNYVEAEKGELRGVEIDCSDFPDLFPVLAVVASYAEGRSVLRARQLRFKESDRVRAMAVNLSRMGIRVRELPDGLEIEGGRPKGGQFETFNDHRIAMAMVVAALGARGESVIPETGSVSKSYPGFFNDLRRLVG